MDQLDLISLDLDGYRQMARAAFARQGPKELAFAQHQEPESIRTRFRKWNRRKHPAIEDGYLLLKHDGQHLREVVGSLGYTLIRKPSQDPADALLELEARAAKGFVSADEVRTVLARTRMAQREESTEDQRWRETFPKTVTP